MRQQTTLIGIGEAKGGSVRLFTVKMTETANGSVDSVSMNLSAQPLHDLQLAAEFRRLLKRARGRSRAR